MKTRFFVNAAGQHCVEIPTDSFNSAVEFVNKHNLANYKARFQNEWIEFELDNPDAEEVIKAKLDPGEKPHDA